MLILRRVIFYFLLLVFLLLCPALLLYASGYIINPLTREVEQTGLVHLNTIPSQAAVYLEQSRFIKTTPATIDKLKPGTYKITLQMPGRRTWTHPVTVTAGKAAVFDKVLLLPSVLPTERLLDGEFHQLALLPGTEFFLMSRDQNLGSFQLYNWKNARAVPLVSALSSMYNFPVLSIFHQEGSRIFILYGGGFWDRKYLVVDTKGETPVFSDITKLFSKDPLLIQWDPVNVNDIFAIYPNYIDRLDIASGAVYPKYLEGVKGCGFHHNKIFLMTAENRFIKYDHEKGKGEPLWEDIRPDNTVLQRNVFYNISFPLDDLPLLLAEDGHLLSREEPYELASKGVIGFKFHDKGKMLMFWTRHRVFMVRFPDEKEAGEGKIVVQEARVTGEDIKQCFWLMDTRHFICNDNDKIYMVEMEPQGSAHEEFLVSIKKGSSMFFSNETGLLYFIDEAGSFQRARLVPKENLVDQLLNKDE